MPTELTPPPPGSLTVPPLFGWEGIATVVALLVVLGVAFLVLATTRSGSGERSEWQGWLDARSGRGEDPAPAPQGPAADDRARSGSGRTGRPHSNLANT